MDGVEVRVNVYDYYLASVILPVQSCETVANYYVGFWIIERKAGFTSARAKKRHGEARHHQRAGVEF